ncbi:MAG TPA: hypothetical protein VG992_03010 [Candidatus Saccharimonadales bacterium]|nr:hypothetical protein [Candidatus Saccharimonadales bacterium]
MYQVDHRRKKHPRRRKLLWLFLLAFITAMVVLIIWILHHIKPDTVIHQSKAITTKVTFATHTKHYDEGVFSIDIPTGWKLAPRPPHTYTSFTWKTSTNGSDGQVIEIYQDTIPVNFAVNRMLVVESEDNHLTVDEPASDDCQNYTRTGVGTYNATGFLAKWQGVSFLCDANNTERDVIGTSSADGVNTVIMRSNDGTKHRFFFTYTDYQLNPDYTLFYNALRSFKMN